MYDLGFALVPYRQELQLFCDFFASGPILLICVYLVIGVRDMKNLTAGELGLNTLPLVETNNAPNAICAGVQDISIGKLISLTLHCSTQFPDSRPPGFENGFPLFGYEGLTDR